MVPTPFGISSQPRKKSKSFSSKGGVSEQDKENNQRTTSDIKTREGSGISEEEACDQEVGEVSFPKTPADKIPLADLIGNTEDAFNCTLPAATPIDHVTWQHEPSSHASSSMQYSQRGKKRAQSSSPMSSSQLQKSAHFLYAEILKTEDGQRPNETPNNDPMEELWNRYARANMSRSKEGEPALPNFAHLLPSSPQTPSTSSKDNCFRRTVSCGIEWPMSNSKRQKLMNPNSHHRTKGIFAASKKEILASGVPQTSRVSMLMDRIQDSLLARHIAEPQAPSSSSPLPDRHSQIVVSPSKAQSPQRRGSPLKHTQDAAKPTAKSQEQYDASSSEFEDDDLDLDFLEQVEQMATQKPTKDGKEEKQQPLITIPEPSAALSQQHTERPLKPPLSEVVRPDTRPQAPGNEKTGVKPETSPCGPAHHMEQKVSEDEFDVDDDDVFTAEMQELAEKYDSQNTGVPVQAIHAISAMDGQMEAGIANPVPQNLVDEFDDADDDELWNNIGAEFVNAAPSVGTTSQVRWP